MTEIELTNSRKAKLIVFKILEYAETGGMLPDDCGLAFEAISNCLDNCDDSSGLIEQIQQILNSGQHLINRICHLSAACHFQLSTAGSRDFFIKLRHNFN